MSAFGSFEHEAPKFGGQRHSGFSKNRPMTPTTKYGAYSQRRSQVNEEPVFSSGFESRHNAFGSIPKKERAPSSEIRDQEFFGTKERHLEVEPAPEKRESKSLIGEVADKFNDFFSSLKNKKKEEPTEKERKSHRQTEQKQRVGLESEFLFDSMRTSPPEETHYDLRFSAMGSSNYDRGGSDFHSKEFRFDSSIKPPSFDFKTETVHRDFQPLQDYQPSNSYRTELPLSPSPLDYNPPILSPVAHHSEIANFDFDFKPVVTQLPEFSAYGINLAPAPEPPKSERVSKMDQKRISYLPKSEATHDSSEYRDQTIKAKGGFFTLNNLFPILFMSPSYKEHPESKSKEEKDIEKEIDDEGFFGSEKLLPFFSKEKSSKEPEKPKKDKKRPQSPQKENRGSFLSRLFSKKEEEKLEEEEKQEEIQPTGFFPDVPFEERTRHYNDQFNLETPSFKETDYQPLSHSTFESKPYFSSSQFVSKTAEFGSSSYIPGKSYEPSSYEFQATPVDNFKGIGGYSSVHEPFKSDYEFKPQSDFKYSIPEYKPSDLSFKRTEVPKYGSNEFQFKHSGLETATQPSSLLDFKANPTEFSSSSGVGSVHFSSPMEHKITGFGETHFEGVASSAFDASSFLKTTFKPLVKSSLSHSDYGLKSHSTIGSKPTGFEYKSVGLSHNYKGMGDDYNGLSHDYKGLSLDYKGMGDDYKGGLSGNVDKEFGNRGDYNFESSDHLPHFGGDSGHDHHDVRSK